LPCWTGAMQDAGYGLPRIHLPGTSVNRGYRLRSMTMRPTMNATKAVPSKTISIKVMTDKVRLLAL
jgi:hypothetical protein